MTYITGRLDRLTHVSGSAWRIKLQGRHAVTVTSSVLEGVRLDYHTPYIITLDGTRRAVSISEARP